MKSYSISLALVFALAAGAAWARSTDAPQQTGEQGYQHVRVVRLSFVDGTVMVRRPGSTAWEQGHVNTPIEEGFSVKTEAGSFAEVEFENETTARLGQLSQMDFTELALAPSGSKINRITFDYGYGTFNFSPLGRDRDHDVNVVKVGAATITPERKAEFRTDYKDGALELEVFGGTVEADIPGQKPARLTKGKILSSQAEEAYNITSGIENDSWDKWVRARDVQAELAYNDSPVGLSQPMDGWADLNEYGAWGFFPGAGYAWSPFVAAGWSPFCDGAWGYYPQFGYTWISNEPWGWLPFHYGTWTYSPSYGYLWQPGQLNTFYPGLVTWFHGPGYVGWAPAGRGGAPACNTGAAGCVIAVKPGTFTGGGAVTPGSRVPVNPGQLTRIARPFLPPSAIAGGARAPIAAPLVARGPAAPLARGAFPNTAHAAPMARTAPTAFNASTHAAPRIVLMGQNPAQAARIEALANRHESFMSRAFGAGNTGMAPARVRLGNTIGGTMNARRVEAMRQNGAYAGPRAMGATGYSRQSPVFFQGRYRAGASSPSFQMNRQGAIRMQSSGMRASAPSYQGGFHGMSSGGGMRASAPSASMGMSHATSAASSGGPHR